MNADKHGRLNSPHVERFERRLRFIQAAKPKEQPYADRDGRWGLADITRDAMLAIMEYEAVVADNQKGLFPEKQPKSVVTRTNEHLIAARHVMYDEHPLAKAIDEFLAIPPVPDGFIDPYAPDAVGRLREAMNKPVSRDSDGTATAAENGDLPVPQDLQARPERIAQELPQSGSLE